MWKKAFTVTRQLFRMTSWLLERVIITDRAHFTYTPQQSEVVFTTMQDEARHHLLVCEICRCHEILFKIEEMCLCVAYLAGGRESACLQDAARCGLKVRV
ncbi:hypothetical protein AMELA_G00219890 [Ameiurus melas]|uniref:Uncharacterized protein n=1 Tax=Ameiurus melas TaxID=219545 RepID=A0A7J6A1U8_AMEME|nr:hypothetical protein AMELA_G00219890 [Ameiurus melas]